MIYSGELFIEANYNKDLKLFSLCTNIPQNHLFFLHIHMDLLTPPHPRSHWEAAGMVTLTPHAVSGVIDHRQINIRSAGEQDRHWSPEEKRTCHITAHTKPQWNICQSGTENCTSVTKNGEGDPQRAVRNIGCCWMANGWCSFPLGYLTALTKEKKVKMVKKKNGVKRHKISTKG